MWENVNPIKKTKNEINGNAIDVNFFISIKFFTFTFFSSLLYSRIILKCDDDIIMIIHIKKSEINNTYTMGYETEQLQIVDFFFSNKI